MYGIKLRMAIYCILALSIQIVFSTLPTTVTGNEPLVLAQSDADHEWQSKGGTWNFSAKQIFGQGASGYNKAFFAGTNYSDFIYEVRLRKISNNDGPIGLLMRYDEQRDEGYMLEIWPHGDYLFSRLVNQTRHKIGGGTPNVLNKGNAWNNVKVIGQGNVLKLYINGEHQVTFDGSAYSFGRLGLIIHGTPDQKAEFFVLSTNAF